MLGSNSELLTLLWCPGCLRRQNIKAWPEMSGHFSFQKNSPDHLFIVLPSDSIFYTLKEKPSRGSRFFSDSPKSYFYSSHIWSREEDASFWAIWQVVVPGVPFLVLLSSQLHQGWPGGRYLFSPVLKLEVGIWPCSKCDGEEGDVWVFSWLLP